MSLFAFVVTEILQKCYPFLLDFIIFLHNDNELNLEYSYQYVTWPWALQDRYYFKLPLLQGISSVFMSI